MNITPKNLRDAAELISEPGTWTKFGYASATPAVRQDFNCNLDAAGNVVPALSVMDPAAKCFCMVGAVTRAKQSDVPFLVADVLSASAFDHEWIPEFNDDPDTTQEDVVTALLLAAEFLASEEGWDEA